MISFKGASKALFRSRLNRFLASAVLDDEVMNCFLPNPGRLRELLIRGAEILLVPRDEPWRKTRFDIVAVFHGDSLVSVDSRIPNKLIRDALVNGELEGFMGYRDVKAEYVYGDSRFDFLLAHPGKCLLEVKSCTLVKEGVALFPDAPTERGRRHIEGLISAKNDGFRSCVAFIVQRGDVHSFSPNRETDEAFALSLERAYNAGVEILAYSCSVDLSGIKLKRQIPVFI